MLLFADDLICFRRIVNTSYCFLLQADLDAVQMRCNIRCDSNSTCLSLSNTRNGYVIVYYVMTMRSKHEVLCAAAGRLAAERSKADKPAKAHKTIFAPDNINYFFVRHCQNLRIFSYVNGF
jgi:hypothetical protein